jgi:signal transduction histidine kinase
VTDSLLKVIQENKRDSQEVDALNTLSANYARTDVMKAKTYLYASIDLATNINANIPLSHAYGQMVPIQLNTGHADSAQYYLSQLQKLYETTSLEPVKLNYNFVAGLFYQIQGNYRKALDYMLESLKEIAIRAKEKPVLGNRITLAGQNLNIGNNYDMLGDYKSALQYHLKALQLFEELDNKKGVSFCYQGIGTDFLKLSQYPQAWAYTEKSKVIKRELGDERGVATALMQLGNICVATKQYDSAINFFMQSLKMARALQLTSEEAELNTAIGQAYALKKDVPNAEYYYNNSKLLAQQIRDSSRVAAADAALTALQTTIHKQQTAEKELVSTLKTSIEAGDKQSELLNYQYLADHYTGTKEFEKALAYSNKFHEINDSLQSMNVQMQMKKMEEQYNLEKKEQEIALLKKDQQVTHLSLQKQKTFQVGTALFLFLLVLIGFLVINRYLIVQKARRLIEMEKMRNRIAQDLHDDIGSALTSINVLSNVAIQANEKEDGLMQTSFKKIKERSSAIMESMDDIVWAINPQNDTMEQLLFRMKEFAGEILEPLNIHYSFDESGNFSSIKLDIRKRKDLYLIFKEAVNNSAKYSQCNNLLIRLYEKKQFLQMDIEDDGKGFSEEIIRNGNGLKNMRERAESMSATIRIDSIVSKGTQIAVNIPIT